MFLKRLETLDVSHNLLGGGLWGPMVSSWENVKVLDLNDNRFVSFLLYVSRRGVYVCKLLFVLPPLTENDIFATLGGILFGAKT